jgi:hypothetical protein
MTNSRAGFSAVAALAIFTFMGFAPGALAQGTVTGPVESVSVALGQTSAALLMLAPAPGHEPPCTNRGRDKRGGCTAVPEGGTTLLYLLIVGLCCVTTATFAMRRQAQARLTE